jgi:hypothetical protein
MNHYLKYVVTGSILTGIILLLSVSALTSCKKCKGENPRARIVNNGNVVANVQIKTTGGNTENINNIEPGAESDYRSYASGDVTFTITIGKDNVVKTVPMAQCFEYDIAIDKNNNVTSTPRDRND